MTALVVRPVFGGLLGAVLAWLLVGCGRSGVAVQGEPALSPLAAPLTRRAEAARVRLDVFVRAHAATPEQPWALTHALLALGPELKVGESAAIDLLFSRWAAHEEGHPGFPTVAEGVAVEPHPDLVLKTLVELGVPPTRSVEVAGRASTVAALYAGASARGWAAPDRPAATWDDSAWTLHALAAWTAPHEARLDAATAAAAAQLVQDMAPIADALRSGAPLVKERQGIFGYACGGAHWLQAVGTLVGRGHGGAEDRAAMVGVLPAHLGRLEAELALTDAAIEAHPDYRLLLVVQRLKLLGHWLETTHRLAALGLLPADAEARRRVAEANEALAATVEALDAAGAWTDLSAIRAEREQTWLDLLGDGSHALRALELSAGRARVGG
jgi:hypothetical protein